MVDDTAHRGKDGGAVQINDTREPITISILYTRNIREPKSS